MYEISFSTQISYLDHWEDERGTKIVVSLQAPDKDGDHTYLSFILDTGAPWCVLDPQWSRRLQSEDTGERVRLSLRGRTFRGPLLRIPLTFGHLAAERLEIEATVLVPEEELIGVMGDAEQWEPIGDWQRPNFLGLSAMDRMWWALQPDKNALYLTRPR